MNNSQPAQIYPYHAADPTSTPEKGPTRKRKAANDVEGDGEPVKRGRKKREPGQKKKPLKNIYAPSPSTIVTTPSRDLPLPPTSPADGYWSRGNTDSLLEQQKALLEADPDLEKFIGANGKTWKTNSRSAKRLAKLARDQEEREKKEAEAASLIATRLAIQRAEAEGALDAVDNAEIADEDDADPQDWVGVNGISENAAENHCVTDVKPAASDASEPATFKRQDVSTITSQDQSVNTVVQSPPCAQKGAERAREDIGGANTSEPAEEVVVVDPEVSDNEEDQSETDEEGEEPEEPYQQKEQPQKGHVEYKRPGPSAYAGQRSLKQRLLGRKR